MMRAAVAVQVYSLIALAYWQSITNQERALIIILNAILTHDNMNQGAAKSEFELLLRDVWAIMSADQHPVAGIHPNWLRSLQLYF